MESNVRYELEARPIDRVIYTKITSTDYGFMSYEPLARMVFLNKHKFISEKDFEILLFLHRKKIFEIKEMYIYPAGYGRRRTIDFKARMEKFGWFEVYNNNAPGIPKRYQLSQGAKLSIMSYYKQAFCMTKINPRDLPDDKPMTGPYGIRDYWKDHNKAVNRSKNKFFPQNDK
jgi:hypothetical protein